MAKRSSDNRGETAISKAVRKYLDATAGVFGVRVQSGVARGGKQRLAKPGTADWIGVIWGTPVAIEFKAEWGIQSDAQKEFAEKWRRCGGVYTIVREVQDAVRLVFEIRWRAGVDRIRHSGTIPL